MYNVDRNFSAVTVGCVLIGMLNVNLALWLYKPRCRLTMWGWTLHRGFSKLPAGPYRYYEDAVLACEKVS